MLDRQSEIIAHFIGQFDQATENLSLRLQYDDMRAARAIDAEVQALLHVEVNVSSVMGLTDFAPGLGLNLPPADLPAIYPASISPVALGPVMPALDLGFTLDIDLGVALHHVGLMPMQYNYATPLFDLTPPGSQAMVAIQENWLTDDDMLLTRPFDLPGELLATRSEAAIDSRFESLVALAEHLDPFATTLTDDGSTASPEKIDAVLDTLASIDPDDAPDGTDAALNWSSNHLDTGADPVPNGRLLVDGELADAAPEIFILRLEDRVEEHGDQAGDGAVPEPSNVAKVASGTAVTTPSVSDEIHQIQTGDNFLVNEVSIGISWVDAPTIAVAGAIHYFTMISQINVWSDDDQLLGGDATGGPGTIGHNVASVGRSAQDINPFGDPGHSGGPGTYAIAEVEGDLVMRSYTVQLNLVSDDDVVSFETTFHEVDIGLGANDATNLALLQGFHYGFETILVGGDMISMVSLRQLNLLGDDDLVATAPGTGGDISTSGNLLWNEAHVGWSGIDTETGMTDGVTQALGSLNGAGPFNPFALDGEGFLAASPVGILLTIGGDFINEHHLVQINMLSDADTVQLHAGALETAGFARIDIETGDNLLANIANASVDGMDSTVMAGGGVYDDVVIYQAGMYGDDPDALDYGDDPGGALASEAVAFLADGMIEPGHGPDDDGHGPDYGPDGCGSGTHDALSTMVA